MKRFRLYRILAPAVAVLSGAGLFLSALPASAQQDPRFGRIGVKIPEPTGAGTWDGTWLYSNRDWRVGLWLRSRDGRPEMRFRFRNVSSDEEFTTDWNGLAEYTSRDGKGRFHLDAVGRDANTIEGTWNWSLEFPDSSRLQNGKVKIYRTGNGRRLALVFDDLVWTIRRGNEEQATHVKQPWTFRKISKRQILWEEMPF